MTTLPLEFADVLAEESRRLGFDTTTDLSFDIREEDIADPHRLRDRVVSSEIWRRVASRFWNGTFAGLEDQAMASDALRKTLAEKLTALLAERTLFATAGANVRDHTRLLFADAPSMTDADVVRANRAFLEDILEGDLLRASTRRERAVITEIHAGRPRAALCLSGGGIRSATFAQGVLQALARRGLLQQFDYLSTVSGGGYAGSWLSAWVHRHREGIDGVAGELKDTAAREGSAAPAEPPQVEYLRTYSNYLTPKLGALSLDTWTVFALVARNLLLHWLLILPLLATATLVPMLFVSLLRESWAGHIAVFGTGMVLLTSAIAYINLQRPSAAPRNWPPRAFKRFALTPLIVGAIAFAMYWAAVADVVGRPEWSVPMRLRLSLLQLLVLLGAIVNVAGWLVRVVLSFWIGAARGELPRRSVIGLELLYAALAGAIGGVLTWVVAVRVLPEPLASAENLLLYATTAVPLFLTIFLVAETLFAGAVSRWTNDQDREWWARAAAWILIVLAAWVAVFATVLFGPPLLYEFRAALAAIGGVSGIVAVLLARSANTSFVRQALRSEKLRNLALAITGPVFLAVLLAAVSLAVAQVLRRTDVQPFLGESGLAFNAIGFNVPLIPRGEYKIVALLTVWRPASVVVAILLASLVGVFTARVLNINKFSLHGLYRNRLIRAYLGASNPFRAPNKFTGFDEYDNLEMAALRDTLYLSRANVADEAKLRRVALTDERLAAQLRLETRRSLRNEAPDAMDLLIEDLNRLLERPDLETLLNGSSHNWFDRHGAALKPLAGEENVNAIIESNRRLLFEWTEGVLAPAAVVPRPLHIINTTLNLVAGGRLAWQQRKAEPFSISALHCGSFRVGYRDAAKYGKGTGPVTGQSRPISLGTAVAISGAAASPNMGYHSSPSATLLMTLFNARLGWWLGNPGVAGHKSYRRSHPPLAIKPLIDEAFGLTTDTNAHIYLSDGGHFENLGLYEMVLRRCHFIVLSDAGQDGEYRFDDLGNAIRKIRVDLQIPIDFDEGLPFRPEEKQAYCAVGHIRYSHVDRGGRDGVLVYIKPAVYERKSEPRDVINYHAATKKVFPHEPTADQWFSESQFESYRALGFHAVEQICRGRSGTAADFAKWSFAHAYDDKTLPRWVSMVRPDTTIHFESSSDIVAGEVNELRRIAEVVRDRPDARVSLVSGVVDTAGRVLAERVAASFEQLGLTRDRIEIAVTERRTTEAPLVDVFVD